MLDQSTSQDEKQEMLDVQTDFTDQLGVLTHHDAVTGTADNRVVLDYSTRLFNIIEKDRKVYAKQVGKRYGGEWLSCFRENSTYHDCPISNHENADQFQIVVHNPADIEQRYINIALP